MYNTDVLAPGGTWEGLPESLRGGIYRYLHDRVPPGSFLASVLTNNLRETFRRADSDNIKIIHEIVEWCYYNLPGISWGSEKMFFAWINGEMLREADEISHPTPQ